MDALKMKRKDIEKKFYEIVADIFKRKVSELNQNTRFVEDLNAKSMDIVALVAATESAFGIETERNETSKNLTIKQAIDYIIKKLKEKTN